VGVLAGVLACSSARAEEPVVLETDFVVDQATLERLLQEGRSLAKRGKQMEAALRFHDVASHSQKGSVAYQEGEFELAVALHKVDLHQAALSRFEPIVDAGPSHPNYSAALPYLVEIARHAPEAGVLGLIAGYDPALFPEAYADELWFSVGQHRFNTDHLEPALEAFGKVTEKHHEFYVRARYLAGVAHVILSKIGVDPKQADAAHLEAGANAFKDVLRHERDEGGGEEVERVAAMAHQALGRLFFSTRQYKAAVRYYDRVGQDAKDWLQGLFELSWVYFQLKNYPRALGNLHTLNSPYFADQYFPEAWVLQALILFYACHYAESLDIVKAFVQDYYPLLKELETEIGRFTDPSQFYAWLAKLAKGTERAEFSVRFKRIFNAALADTKLRQKFSFVGLLNQEQKRLEELSAQYPTAVALVQALQGEIQSYRTLVLGEAGALAQARLQRVLKDLRGHLAGALKIKGEALKAQRGVLADSIREEQALAAAATNVIEVDAEHFEWPFTGEYWKDELGFYLYDIASKCQTK
jgi:tetratricopeptide (TPR) repeat protein